MNKRCSGCGICLQATNKEKLGYVRAEKLESSFYCERCFKIMHYNEKLIVPQTNSNEEVIENCNKSKKLTFFLIDCLNINKETIATYNKITNPKVVVITKIDVLPKSLKEAKITTLLKEVYSVKEPILYLSTLSNKNTKSIYRIMEQKKTKEAYILGYTNAGKSTLINKLNLEHINNVEITTSNIPNTTLDTIKIKIDEEHTFIDTPGFMLKNTFYQEHEIELLNKLIPKKRISPITLQVKEKEIVHIENKLYIESNKKNSMTFYMSNALSIEKIFKNIENEYIEYSILDNSDIVLLGIGFINIKKACILKISSKYKEIVEIRESIFKEA